MEADRQTSFMRHRFIPLWRLSTASSYREGSQGGRVMSRLGPQGPVRLVVPRRQTQRNNDREIRESSRDPKTGVSPAGRAYSLF